MLKTCQPLIQNQTQLTRAVANFWNKTSDPWRLIWGPHIHHGYYEDNVFFTPVEAQERLLTKLADMLDIQTQNNILDVGCGMGGSSIYFSQKYHANVTGITLSHKQISIANELAKQNNINNIIFKIEDAMSLHSFASNSFDIVWSLESCEQFYDKSLFLKNALRILRPGGKLMLATWCSDQEEYEGSLAKKYKKLCLAFDLPYMPTIEYYRLLLGKHFNIQKVEDWSDAVKKSWDIGISLIHSHSLWRLFKMGGWHGLRFIKQIKSMRNAFKEGRVRYGVFLAKKPENDIAIAK